MSRVTPNPSSWHVWHFGHSPKAPASMGALNWSLNSDPAFVSSCISDPFWPTAGPVSSKVRPLRHKGLEWITNERPAWLADADVVVVLLAAVRAARHLVARAALFGLTVGPRRMVLQVAAALPAGGNKALKPVALEPANRMLSHVFLQSRAQLVAQPALRSEEHT